MPGHGQSHGHAGKAGTSHPHSEQVCAVHLTSPLMALRCTTPAADGNVGCPCKHSGSHSTLQEGQGPSMRTQRIISPMDLNSGKVICPRSLRSTAAVARGLNTCRALI